MFEKLERRIVIDYEIETLSDLHIGGGSTTAPGEVDLSVIKNSDGFPIIPGSSLKGVLRSEMEKLLRAKMEDEKQVTNRSAELFGGAIDEKDHAGSIRIRDATAGERRTVIRDHVKIDSAKRKAKRGGKFDVEAVPKGVVFTGEMYIENPKLGGGEYCKLGALLSTVRFFNATTRSLGGATSRGYGEVILRIKQIREFTADDYLDGNFNGKKMDLTENDEKEIIGQWREYVLGLEG